MNAKTYVKPTRNFMKKTFTLKNHHYLLQYDQEEEVEQSHSGPDDFLIRNIMNYSKALLILQSRNSGIMRIILN